MNYEKKEIEPEEDNKRELIKENFSKIGLSLFAATILASIILGIILALFSGQSESNAVIKIIHKLLLIFICILIIRKVDKKSIKKHNIGISYLVFFICFDITITIFGDAIGQGIISITSEMFGIKYPEIVDGMYSGNSIWMIILSAVIVTPIIEECIFRKILIDRLIIYGQGVAILISSLMFGFIHMNISQLFYTFGSGLIYGYVYVITGRVKYTIIMHMISNIIGGVIPLLIYNTTLISKIYDYIFYMFGIIGILLFIKNKKNIKIESDKMNLNTKNKLLVIFCNPGMILFFGLCILNMFLIAL